MALKGNKLKILSAVDKDTSIRQFSFVHEIDKTVEMGIGREVQAAKKGRSTNVLPKQCREQ